MAQAVLGSRDAVSVTGALLLAGVVLAGGAVPSAAQRQTEIRRSTTAVSCQVLTEDDLKNEPTVAHALQGRVPGLQLLPGSGQVGAGTRVNVRGVNSATHSPPLVFLDWVLTRSAGGESAVTILDQLNPSDILLIEVFRGPAATALFGTDATGGVIRIFTKHGNPRAELLADEHARCVP